MKTPCLAVLVLSVLLAACYSGSTTKTPAAPVVPVAPAETEAPSQPGAPEELDEPDESEAPEAREKIDAPKNPSPAGTTRTLPDPDSHYRVKWVYDGDSIDVWLTEDKHLGVRYLGLDTPEHGEPMSEEAKRANMDLVKKKEVRIVTDPDTDRHFDRYGRVLGYIYVMDQDGVEVMVNESLLRRGLASYYPYGDPLHEEARLRAAQDAARTARAGIWSLPHEPAPHYVGTKRRFHRPDCKGAKFAKDPRRFETREAALDAHLSPCRECKP